GFSSDRKACQKTQPPQSCASEPPSLACADSSPRSPARSLYLIISLLPCFALCSFRQQLLQAVFPQHRPGVAAMAMRILAERNQGVLAVRQALRFAFGDPQLRRINEVVGGIHPGDTRGDFFELRRRVVVTRSVYLIQEVVGVGRVDVRL